MTQKPMLNLGCGRVILPAPKPAHYGLLDPIESYALWHNVDRNELPGVDTATNIFRYPFEWEDNSFDGALCAHLCEHIPHQIDLWDANVIERSQLVLRSRLSRMQDGWFAFFSELWRVLTPGSIIHILSPYAWSNGAMHDPSHTRYLTPESFQHSMTPNPDAPFAYATGGLHLELVEPPRVNVMPEFQHLAGNPILFQQAVNTQLNVISEFAVKLRVIK